MTTRSPSKPCLRLASHALAAVVVFAVVSAALAGPARAQPAGDLIRQSYQQEARGDLAGAIATMRQVKPAGSLAYFVALRTGWLAYLAGKWSDAEAGYRAALVAAPKSLEAQLGLTLPLMAMKRWREVEKVTRAVLKRDPGNAIARTRLAQALYSLGSYDEAATVYAKLKEDYPSETVYANGVGWSLYQLGKKADAKRVFDAVLAVAPDDASAKQGKAAP
jgi:tetratricopeptide (TPR) repeat protein